jgi:hypothetical protein
VRAQRLRLWCGVAVGMAAIALASPIAAQGPALRGSIPRTADGHPDLQGCGPQKVDPMRILE